MLEFGEYKPDLPPILNDGLTRAEGVLPQDIGYAQIPQASVATASALAERPQGMFAGRDPSAVGTTYLYVGTASKLYVLSGSSWVDVSGAAYSTANADIWSFAQWGSTVMATNFADPVQTITFGGVAFAALGGSPPQARYVTVVDNFAVLANLQTGGNFFPQRIAWSDEDDNTVWTPTTVNQAGTFDLLNNGGWIQGIVGGEYGIIFQEFSILRMSYIGPPKVFQFDTLEQDRGAYAAGSIIPFGRNIAYLSSYGFYIFDGAKSHPIGEGKIDASFWAESGPLAFDRNYIDRITSALYPNEQILSWSYPSVNADPAGVSDVILFYNYSPNARTRWSVLRTNTADADPGRTNVNNYGIASPLSQGYTLDGLDVVSTNIDALPEPPPDDISLDSPVWSGQQKLFGMVTEGLDLAFFNSGSYYDAFIETGEYQLNPPNRTSITMIRPFVNDPSGSATILVAVSGRDTEQSTASFSNTVTVNTSGFANVRVNSRFQRAFVRINNGFSHAEGIDIVQSTKVGRR